MSNLEKLPLDSQDRKCVNCGLSIPTSRRPFAKFCGEKCRRKAEHLRGWAGGWIKSYHMKNKDKIRGYNKSWHKENPEKDAATRLKHRDKRLIALKAWKKRNPERVKELRRASSKRHPRPVYRIKWLAENAERMREHKRKWKHNHPAETRADAMRRNASKLMAVPPWLTKEQRNNILDIYRRCSEIKKETGFPYEVDHIIPLRGENVCGLHVSWNLQILTRSENARKHNKLLPALCSQNA